VRGGGLRNGREVSLSNESYEMKIQDIHREKRMTPKEGNPLKANIKQVGDARGAKMNRTGQKKKKRNKSLP